MSHFLVMTSAKGQITAAAHSESLRFSSHRSTDAAAGTILLLLLCLSTFLFIRAIGLVSDDFFLLVENLKLPLTQSADELHRPLRNILLKLLGNALGVRHAWPYRFLVAVTYTAVMALIFQFMRRLGAGRFGAWVAVIVMTFFPRNQEVLFWFAAWQDLAAALCLLAVCLLFLNHREKGRRGYLAGAAIAFAAALGFKETMVVIPALLLLIDVYRERSIECLKKPAFWRAYLPFAGVLVLYVVYYVSDSGLASLAGHRTGGMYGFRGVSSVVGAVLRTIVNMALPFVIPAPLGLSNIRPIHLAILLAELVVVLVLTWRTKAWSMLLFASCWAAVTILPTAVFASVLNADRYLFVPLIGAAILAGFLLNPAKPELKHSLLIATVLAAYSFAGTFELIRYRAVWKRAGDEVSAVAAQTIQASSRLSRAGEIDLINQTTFLSPYVVSVFANGLDGALRGNGLPSRLRVLANFASTEPLQQSLVNQMRNCIEPRADPQNRIIRLTIDHRLVQVDGRCAASLIDSDRAQRPSAWRLFTSAGDAP